MEIINKIIELAKSEIGYIEKATNSNLDSKIENAGNKNFTKFARDLDIINYFNGDKNGYPWCACFVNWLLVKAYNKETALNITGQPKSGSSGAECTFLMNYFKGANQFYTAPKQGDFILFTKDNKTSHHVGFVIGVSGDTVTTVEGNTSGGNEVVDNGGMVCQKSYKLNNSHIIGYGRPKYFEIIKEDDEVVENKTYLIDGKEVNINTILKGGKNYIEVTGLANAIGYDVKYDTNTKTVALTKIINTIKMKINGVLKDVNRILINGVNFVKIRDFEDEKIKVGYDENEKLPTLDVK